MDEILSSLARHPYFASLPAPLLAVIRAHVVCRHHQRGALVHAEGERSRGLTIVAAGRIRVFKGSPDGKEQDLYHVGPGGSVNDAAAFDGGPYIASAEAVEGTDVLLVPREALRDLVAHHPEIAASVIDGLAGRVRALSDLVGELSLRHVISRIAGLLLRLAAADGSVVLPPRHRLASMAGTAREVAARALRYLERLGALRLEPRGRARILDRALLEACHVRAPRGSARRRPARSPAS